MVQYEHISLRHLTKKGEVFEPDSSIVMKKDIPSYEAMQRSEKQACLPTLTALILQKTSEADSETLKKLVEIVSNTAPETSSEWNWEIIFNDLSRETLDRVKGLFSIHEGEYKE